MAQAEAASTIEQPTSGCLQIQSCSGCSSSITAFTPLHSNHRGGGGSFHDRWGQAPPVIADHLNYSGEAALQSRLAATCCGFRASSHSAFMSTFSAQFLSRHTCGRPRAMGWGSLDALGNTRWLRKSQTTWLNGCLRWR